MFCLLSFPFFSHQAFEYFVSRATKLTTIVSCASTFIEPLAIRQNLSVDKLSANAARPQLLGKFFATANGTFQI